VRERWHERADEEDMTTLLPLEQVGYSVSLRFFYLFKMAVLFFISASSLRIAFLKQISEKLFQDFDG
jgi:hypothetical protein